MPLQNNHMTAQFYGATPRAQLIDKIAQLRTDLNRMQQALNAVDRQVQANASGSAMQPQFSLLYNWMLSAMESFYAMVWVAYDRDKLNEVMKDFEMKFKDFTSARSIIPSGR